MKTVLVSGGFDPLHIGHINYLHGAHAYGRVIVALNSGAWLRKKKGFIVMSWSDRAAILNSIGVVHGVIPVDDKGGSVCDALRKLRPDYFANGGDRTEADSNDDEVTYAMG